jgi:hypothetical protein
VQLFADVEQVKQTLEHGLHIAPFRNKPLKQDVHKAGPPRQVTQLEKQVTQEFTSRYKLTIQEVQLITVTSH